MTKSRSASSSAGRTPLRIRADAPGASGDLTTRPAPVATVRRARASGDRPVCPEGSATFVPGDAARMRGSASSPSTVPQDSFPPVRPDVCFVPLRDRGGVLTLAAATQQGQPLSKPAEILLELVTRSVPDRAGAPLARQDFAGSRRRRYC